MRIIRSFAATLGLAAGLGACGSSGGFNNAATIAAAIQHKAMHFQFY
jgi:hypothetical protein